LSLEQFLIFFTISKSKAALEDKLFHSKWRHYWVKTTLITPVRLLFMSFETKYMPYLALCSFIMQTLDVKFYLFIFTF